MIIIPYTRNYKLDKAFTPELNVLACNHSNRVRTIPKGTMLGFSIQINPIAYINSDTSLNELDSTGDLPEQRDFSLLSTKEKDEWKTFIRELHLDENHILNAKVHICERK